MPADPANFVPPPGSHLNEYGRWILPNGDFAYRHGPGDAQYDAQGRMYYIDQQGQKSYVSPMAQHKADTSDQGGLIHGRSTWDQHTGEYEQGLDWGNILSMVVAGALTVGMADAIMGASAGTTEALMEGGAGAANTGGAAGVQAGLLGPSAETMADVAFADGTGGVTSGLLGSSAETARDVTNAASGGNTPSGGGSGLGGLTTEQAIRLLGPLLGGLGEGLLQQHRQSFEGDASASNILGKATHGLDDLSGKLNAEKAAGVQLRGAPEGASPTFTGGGLPMPIGLRSRGSDPSLSLGSGTSMQNSDPFTPGLTRRTSEGTRASTQPGDFDAMRASLKLLGDNYKVFG